MFFDKMRIIITKSGFKPKMDNSRYMDRGKIDNQAGLYSDIRVHTP